ncbi:MAG TPA: anti-sigma factor [Anaeromyxobacter sp.]
MATDPQNLVAVMDCSEIERSVDAYLDGEFDERERAEADAHLATCEACRGLADRHGRVRAALRATLRAAMGASTPAGRAPEAFRARLSGALEKVRRPLWRRALSPVPLATAAACAAGALVVLAGHSGDDALLEEAVRIHNRDLPMEVFQASVESIPAWFQGKLDFHPSPPRFPGEAQMVGARLSHLREWPAAYIRYELPRGHAGLFIVDDPRGRFDVAGREIREGPRTMRFGAAHGYNVVVWRQDEIVYSLVSDLDEAALVRLVRNAQAGR